MCGAFHGNGRPHSLTLRYRVTGFNNLQGTERHESSFRFLFSREKEPAGGPRIPSSGIKDFSDEFVVQAVAVGCVGEADY